MYYIIFFTDLVSGFREFQQITEFFLSYIFCNFDAHSETEIYFIEGIFPLAFNP